MVAVDRSAPVEFLYTAFKPTDWVAVFMKTFATGETAQRVVPVSIAAGMRFQSWLRHQNANGWNVYVSVNAVRPGRSRTRRAIAAVRHVFLEEDRDGPALLAKLGLRGDLPPVSYVLNSSPGRLHVFWRAMNFQLDHVERLQKHLARELGTDPAATSCAQTTRLPGFMNHKRKLPHRVTAEYPDRSTVSGPSDFPAVGGSRPRVSPTLRRPSRASPLPADEQARRFLADVPAAVAGQHGDVHTFRVCCRLVRGFALSDGEALELLGQWNRRCEPPWSTQELVAKLRNARRYGREPLGALVHFPADRSRLHT
jgi:hypothetical protein